MSVETLRKEAARKRMLVEALEEEGRAEDLRASAERAAKRATELRSQAGSGSGSGEEVLGAFATLAALGAVGYWLFG